MKSTSIHMRDFTSPRVRGEVDAKRRVRGAFREFECVESPLHPDLPRASFARLDPARGEKESFIVELAGRA